MVLSADGVSLLFDLLHETNRAPAYLLIDGLTISVLLNLAKVRTGGPSVLEPVLIRKSLFSVRRRWER